MWEHAWENKGVISGSITQDKLWRVNHREHHVGLSYFDFKSNHAQFIEGIIEKWTPHRFSTSWEDEGFVASDEHGLLVGAVPNSKTQIHAFSMTDFQPIVEMTFGEGWPQIVYAHVCIAKETRKIAVTLVHVGVMRATHCVYDHVRGQCVFREEIDWRYDASYTRALFIRNGTALVVTEENRLKIISL